VAPAAPGAQGQRGAIVLPLRGCGAHQIWPAVEAHLVAVLQRACGAGTCTHDFREESSTIEA
jgi:hypothetical protein